MGPIQYIFKRVHPTLVLQLLYSDLRPHIKPRRFPNRSQPITLKPIDGVVPLPKFEDYITASDRSKLERLEPGSEEYSFKWQEKILSPWEVHQYRDQHNCRTDQQIKYHEIIKKEDISRNRLFTYIDEDNYETEALTTNQSSLDDIKGMQTLGTCFKRLNLSDSGETKVIEPSLRSLGNKSVCRSDIDKEEWISMHVMMDGSEQDGDIEVVIKREGRVLSLHWNEATGCLVLSPDVNSLDWNPYVVEAGGVRWDYHYAVQLSQRAPEHHVLETKNQLIQFIKKLQRKWERKHRHLLNFSYPPPSATRYYYTVQILNAVDFEDDNIYIEYEVRTSPDCKCSELPDGRTHTAKRQGSVANYSHVIEFELEYGDDGGPEGGVMRSGAQLYMEVISVSWWECERTQGAARCALPLLPGAHSIRLPCLRPESGPSDQSRRFFLGGARLLDDKSWLGVPEGHEGRLLNKFGIRCVTTGAVEMRVTVVSQGASAAGAGGDSGGGGGVSAGALFRSVDAVLHEYRHARDRLIDCKRRLQIED